jgi:hypothetical protein
VSLTILASAVKAIPPFDFSVIALAPAEVEAALDATFWLRARAIAKFSFPGWFDVIRKARTPAG